MDFRWKQLNLTWVTSLKKTRQTSKKKSKHVTISSLTLSLKHWEKGRQRVFNFPMSTFDNSLINKKLDLVFKGRKCAAKVNLIFGFVLKNVENGSCRYSYAHENYTVMEMSKLVYTPNDITNLEQKLQKMDIVDLCTQERANTKWKFYKLTKLTVFAALLKDVPMSCKDSVLPEPLLKNQNMTCLTFEEYIRKPNNDQFCVFREVALHLFGNRDLRKKHPKFSNFFWTIVGRRSIKVLGCSHDWYSESGGAVITQYFSLRHWLCGWIADWGTRTKKYSKVWKECQPFTLPQSNLLSQRHEFFLQIFSLQHKWHNLFKDWKFGVTFDYM